MGTTLRTCRSECLVVSGEEEAKAGLEVPDSSFSDTALFQLVKGDIPL
jgi:hypothetical protein